jgi:hypothetical protein
MRYYNIQMDMVIDLYAFQIPVVSYVKGGGQYA